MRLRHLIILMLPLCLLSTPAFSEEDVVASESVGVTAEAGAEAAESIETSKPDVGHGKAIFDSICIHCHRTDYETSPVGAPGLKDVFERHPEAWIHSWISGPEAFAKKDSTAKDLIGSNPYGLIMPTIPEMQNEKNRQDIMEYLKTF